jgi:hypothetical protein
MCGFLGTGQFPTGTEFSEQHKNTFCSSLTMFKNLWEQNAFLYVQEPLGAKGMSLGCRKTAVLRTKCISLCTRTLDNTTHYVPELLRTKGISLLLGHRDCAEPCKNKGFLKGFTGITSFSAETTLETTLFENYIL